MVLLALVAVLVFTSLVGRLAARHAARLPADAEPLASPAVRAWQSVQARRRPTARLLPQGHRPPAGLGPISPSERFLRAEADRGLRALQMWLLDQDGAST